MGDHLDSSQLSALLDGELDSEKKEQLERHLAECEDCQSEYEALRRQENALIREWRQFRSNECPPPELVAGYVEGRLGQADQQRMSEHVEICAVCEAEVDAARQLFEEVGDVTIRELPTVELLARRFVRQRLPNEISFFDATWAVVKEAVERLQDVPVSDWSLSALPTLAGARGGPPGDVERAATEAAIAGLLGLDEELRRSDATEEELRDLARKLATQFDLPAEFQEAFVVAADALISEAK